MTNEQYYKQLDEAEEYKEIRRKFDRQHELIQEEERAIKSTLESIDDNFDNKWIDKNKNL